MSTEPKADLAALLEDLVDELELEQILSLPPEQTHAELIGEGIDLERVFALRDHLINGGPHPGPRKRKEVTS